MDATALRAIQAPLKQKYGDNPDTSRITSCAEVALDPAQIAAFLPTHAPRIAGLHPATGGTGAQACSGDMLLEALAACAGVTLMAVATSMGAKLTGGSNVAQRALGGPRPPGPGQTSPLGVPNKTLYLVLED